MVDFARLNHIKHVIETDFDTWTDREVESKAKCVLRYSGTMAQILALPVPTYVEPQPVSGEIDTLKRRPNGERKQQMWNQNGNGNGQQNQGYGNGDPYDRFNNAKPINNRDPYIEEGNHTLAVISIEEIPAKDDRGIMERARFLVLESTTMKVGSTVGSVWFIQKPPPKPGMVTDADRFADFCTRLKGAPAGYPIGADIRTLVRDRAADQLARGQVIRAFGVRKYAKNVTEKNKDGFVVVNWTHVPQTPAEIASMRAQIEAKGLHNADGGTGGGQFQGAPHPAQGQPQQPQAQQWPPQGYGPQAGAPQQQQAPQQPQAWGQPQGAPQQLQQGQPGATQTVPQGWGQGNGGGQGQGGW